MRFIHIADIHLGAVPDRGQPWSGARAEELWKSFCRVVQTAEQEQVDLLLIAGDLFHRQPSMRELKEVNAMFRQLSRTQVVLIAGNHDYLDDRSPYRDFPWEDNVIFLNAPDCEAVCFEDLETTVYGFSYYSQEISKPLYDDLVPERRGGCHILLAHGGDEHHIPISRARFMDSGFDYIALGHIHKPQYLAEYIAYSGALEPIDVNDTGEHGYIRGEYANGHLTTEFVPFACREYIHLEIESDSEATDIVMRQELSDAIEEYGRENIYRVTLTGCRDTDIVFHTAGYRELGNIISVEDETYPDFDFAKLRETHAGDLIGRYIEKLAADEGENERTKRIRRQALYYGIKALKEHR